MFLVCNEYMNVTCSNQMLRTHENSDVFNTLDEICLVFTKKSKFSFYFILFRRSTVNQCVNHASSRIIIKKKKTKEYL